MSYIGYDMKSMKMIVSSNGIIHPLYLRILTQGMRCDEILSQGSRNIGEAVLDDFYIH